jgi:hypothetical protein
MPIVWAARSISFSIPVIVRSPYARGCQRTATRDSCGTNSPSSCRLGDQLRAKKGCPGNVPARPCKADHQFVVDWIGHCNCNDGNAAGRLFGRTGSRRAQGDNDINLMLNQFNGDFTEPIWLVFSKFALEADCLLRCNQALATLRSGN